MTALYLNSKISAAIFGFQWLDAFVDGFFHTTAIPAWARLWYERGTRSSSSQHRATALYPGRSSSVTSASYVSSRGV